MTLPLEQRLNYHPDPRNPSASDRMVQARLDLITDKVDFTGKVVLDLGCSGGGFSFELARLAKKVIAVDADAEIISRNRAIQQELGRGNLEFICARIDADLIRRIGPVDVTLLLSVYHHMLTRSEAYDWNAAMAPWSAAEILNAIHANTHVFVFEMGYPNEGYEWCKRLPDFGQDWDDYVLRTVFQGRYASVEVHRPAVRVCWFNRYIISRLSRPYREDPWVVQKVKSLMKFDARNFRKIYIGAK